MKVRDSLKDFERYVIKDNYPDIPDELREFNWYVADAGRCIMSVPKIFFIEAKEKGKENLYDYEIALPVRYVLKKGYEIIETPTSKHVIVDVPYNPEFGAEIDEEYNEYLNIDFPIMY